MDRLSYDKLLAKASKYCSITERCEQDMRKRLAKWQLDSDEIEKMIAYLIQEKYLDEMRFASAFAQDRFRFAKWGKSKINYELRIKNIPSNIINMAVQSIDPNEYLECLTSLLKAKLKNIRYRNSHEIKGKLYRFGINKGFESEIVLKVTEELI